MIERVSVYFAAICGPEFVGGHGAWAYKIYQDVFDREQSKFLPAQLIYEKSGYMVPKEEQTESIVSYEAAISAMDWMVENKKTPHHVRMYGNELRSINQLNKRWKSSGPNAVMWRKADYFRYQFQDIHFTWIGEDVNPCFQMAKKEMLAHGIDPDSFPKPRLKEDVGV